MAYDSYGYYGSAGGYAAAGYGGYQAPGPFYFYNASNALYGPGSAAYNVYQNVTSYAYEGQNGSVYLRNTYQFSSSYQVDTSYSYSGHGETIYDTSETRSSDTPFMTGFQYGPSHYGYDAYGSGYPSNYYFEANSISTYDDSRITEDGNYSTFYTSEGSYAARNDGSYADSSSTFGSETYAGHLVPGSDFSNTAVNIYDAYSGYSYHGMK